MSKVAEKLKPLLSIKELHAELGKAYGINALYNAAAVGKLKTVRVGRKVLVPRSEVEAFIQRESGQ